MDKLIKYRKKFVEFCFENGYDINKIRASKAVTVYECTPAEAWMWQSPFVIHVEDGTDIYRCNPERLFIDNSKLSGSFANRLNEEL